MLCQCMWIPILRSFSSICYKGVGPYLWKNLSLRKGSLGTIPGATGLQVLQWWDKVLGGDLPRGSMGRFWYICLHENQKNQRKVPMFCLTYRESLLNVSSRIFLLFYLDDGRKKTSNYKNWADIGWFFLKTYPDIGECIHRHMFSYLRSLTILIQRFLFSKTTMARENLFWRCIFYRTCSMGLEHLPTFPMGPM